MGARQHGGFRSRTGGLLAAALVIGTAACQSVVVPSGLLPAPVDPFVRHPFPTEGCCGVGGTLEIKGTCVGIRQEGGEWDLLLWPEGAPERLDTEPPRIQVNGTWFAVGEQTKVGGYWAAAGGTSETPVWISEHGIRERCPSERIFVVTDTYS
ncbi:MAG TPA: hypothetical protein VES19_04820 [Candidatus Limnocylindrales bacterium]|nr:hypothetical protein [Candidatus Limnocylindrales bacterium]